MSDRPDLSNRRQIIPAPDEGVDPIDPHKPSAAVPTPAARERKPAVATSQAAKGPRKPVAAKASAEAVERTRDLNLQVTDEVGETIDFAKFKTKLTKREIVQRAVLEYWSDYRPKDS
jgi:hypothetical protein